MSKGTLVGLYATAVVVLLLFMKLLVASTLAANRMMRSASGNMSGSCEPGMLLRPLLLYTQYILIIASLNIEFPSTVTAPLKAVAWFWAPASPQALSIDCLLEGSAAAGTLPIAMLRVLVYICMPLAMLLALLVLEATLLKFAHKSSVRAGMADRLFSSAFVAAFFFLPSIARSLFSLFACVPIDEPAAPPFVAEAVGSFWALDLNMQCWEGQHKVFALGFGVPLLLMMCVGLPACILYKTLSYRHQLANPHVIQHYGFLFRAYKSRFCWWECVIVLQTEALVAISVFGHSIGPMYQALFANALLALMTIILMMARPHAHAAAYRVMLHGVCCLVLTSYIALSFIPSTTYKAGHVYGIVMGCVLVVLNASFLVSFFWQMHKQVDWQDVTDNCRSLLFGAGGWIASKSPWCAERFCCCIIPPELPHRPSMLGERRAGFSGGFRPAEERVSTTGDSSSSGKGKDPAAGIGKNAADAPAGAV
jgi:hypothetical protein